MDKEHELIIEVGDVVIPKSVSTNCMSTHPKWISGVTPPEKVEHIVEWVDYSFKDTYGDFGIGIAGTVYRSSYLKLVKKKIKHFNYNFY